MSNSINIFYAYSHKDERLRKKLETHLALLLQERLISGWHDKNINAGREWEREIDTYLDSAQIILLLISANFLASSYCYSIEMRRAMERHQTGDARVIPIILRPVDWEKAPFSILQVLPTGGKPVTGRSWRDIDEALADVARGIRKAVEEFRSSHAEKLPLGQSYLPTEYPALNVSPSITRLHTPTQKTFHISSKRSPASEKRVDGNRQENNLLTLALGKIFDALHRKSLCLFIGNDLPSSITGLPSRSDLAIGLAYHYNLDTSLPLAEVAQRISQTENRWAFTSYIREAVDIVGKSPQPFHQRIAQLVQKYQINTIITLAYDQLLELSFQTAGFSFNRVVTNSDVAFVVQGRPTLIKLYGDVLQPDTLVVTDRDHLSILRGREKDILLDEIQSALRRNMLLFLGYNLADQDFRFLLDQITESRFAQVAYAVWSGLSENDLLMWRDRGIIILDINVMLLLDALI